jgi:hypothetical protein
MVYCQASGKASPNLMDISTLRAIFLGKQGSKAVRKHISTVLDCAEHLIVRTGTM